MALLELTKENTEHGNLILVNPQFPLIRFPDLTNIVSVMDEKPDIQMDEHAGALLRKLLAYIHCRDEITAVSGFRTQKEQESIWKNSLSENGLDFTRKFVAVPGCSIRIWIYRALSGRKRDNHGNWGRTMAFSICRMAAFCHHGQIS